MLIDFLMVAYSLSCRSDQGHELGELCTEVVNAVLVYLKEEEGFGLLGKTVDPILVSIEYEAKGMLEVQNVALNILEVKGSRSRGCHFR